MTYLQEGLTYERHSRFFRHSRFLRHSRESGNLLRFKGELDSCLRRNDGTAVEVPTEIAEFCTYKNDVQLQSSSFVLYETYFFLHTFNSTFVDCHFDKTQKVS